MKIFVIVASLLAVSLAAPVEELLKEAVKVNRSPASPAELLKLKELELRQQVSKPKLALHALEGADQLYMSEQQPGVSAEELQLAQMLLVRMTPEQILMLVEHFSPVSLALSPKQQLMLQRKRSEVTPQEQAQLMLLEKLAAAGKVEDLVEFQLNQLTPVEQLNLFKQEKLLELQKDEAMLTYKANHLTPLQSFQLLKEEKMLELQKDKALYDYNNLNRLELKKLDLTKDADLFKFQQEETPQEQLIALVLENLI